MGDVYVSTDIESDGPVPGLYSMLSIGSAAYRPNGEPLGTFHGNLAQLSDAATHPEAMHFWESEPDAWAAARVDAQPAGEVISRYRSWLGALPGKPVLVGLPAVFDYAFVSYYLHRFGGDNPFERNAVDVRTYAMAVLRKDWSEVTFAAMPRSWVTGWQHDHTALGDAIAQGELFMKIKRVNDGQSEETSHDVIQPT